MSPPPTNIIRMRSTIGRRVSPNVKRPLSTSDLSSAPSPRLPSGRSRPSSTGYGEGRGEGASPQAQTRGEAPSPGLSPQAGRGEDRPRDEPRLIRGAPSAMIQQTLYRRGRFDGRSAADHFLGDLQHPRFPDAWLRLDG